MPSAGQSKLVVTLVYASTTVVWSSYSLLATVLPFRFEALGLSVVQYGIAIGVFAFGMLLTEGVWGLLAFRIGRARTVLALGAGVAVLYLAVGLSTNYYALVLALGLFGALIIFPVPLFRWMAMIAGGPGTEGSGTGRYGLFFGSGMVAGSALGPLIYVSEGFEVLVIVVVITYLVGVALMVAVPWTSTRLPPAEHGSASPVRRVLTAPFLYVSMLVVLDYLVFTLIVNFLQIYSVSTFHGTPANAGYVIGLSRASLLLAGVLLGGVVDRFGALRSVPFGFLLLAAGALGTLASSTYLGMVLSTLVLSIGIGWLSASLLPLALGPIPAPLQGTAIGVFGSFEDLGLLVGPIAISWVLATFGPSPMFLFVGIVALCGAALSRLYPWVLDRDASRGAHSGVTPR